MGSRIYRQFNCYACHGQKGGGGMGPDLTDDIWKNGDGSDGDLLRQLLEGRGGMPPYKEIMSEVQAWQVIAFVRTLYKGDPDRIGW